MCLERAGLIVRSSRVTGLRSSSAFKSELLKKRLLLYYYSGSSALLYRSLFFFQLLSAPFSFFLLRYSREVVTFSVSLNSGLEGD